MKVTQVSIAQAEAARRAGCRALPPELLAAVSARYSRNNSGIDAILASIDQYNPDQSIDRIFNMVDYGHRSIGDMVPVAMFIDGITIYLAYHLWHLLSTAAGQESSTRYIRFTAEGIVDPEHLGFVGRDRTRLIDHALAAFDRYQRAERFWVGVAEKHPEVVRIPDGVDRKVADRMRRNYGFDRARVFIPAIASTNVMLIMRAKDWVDLISVLLSSQLLEARNLGASIRNGLELTAPRLIKHAVATTDRRLIQMQDFDDCVDMCNRYDLADSDTEEQNTTLRILDPKVNAWYGPKRDVGEYLNHHAHRYSGVSVQLGRLTAQLRINKIAFAELRDLNRHRTGHRYCPFVPVGFNDATDQVPNADTDHSEIDTIFGITAAMHQRSLLSSGVPESPYWALLGTQVPFEHTTSLDKMVYEIELRTGTGAHYQYARHMRDAHQCLAEQFPTLAEKVICGLAEPE